MGWFNTPEFYIIAATVAAAAVVFISRPPVRRVLKPWQFMGSTAPGCDAPERVDITAGDYGYLDVRHTGINPPLSAASQIWLDAYVDHDARRIILEEYTQPGTRAQDGDQPVREARYTVEGATPGAEYRLKFTSYVTGLQGERRMTIDPGAALTFDAR